MAEQKYRVQNAVGMWLRTQPVLGEVTKDVLLPHGQLVIKIADTNDPSWWQISSNYQGADHNGYCKHALMVPDAEFNENEAATSVVAVHLDNSSPVLRDQRNLEAFRLNESPHPTRDANGTPQEKIAAIGEIVKWLGVTQNKRYLPLGSETYCNIYAYDFCCLVGAFVPRVWWTDASIDRLNAGQAVTPKWGVTVNEYTANQLAYWFRSLSQIFGWRKTDSLTELQQAANNGSVCIINARRTVGHGHICPIVPETAVHKAVWDNAHQNVIKPLTSQAGGQNFEYKPFRWWEDGTYRNIGFWIHD